MCTLYVTWKNIRAVEMISRASLPDMPCTCYEKRVFVKSKRIGYCEITGSKSTATRAHSNWLLSQRIVFI